MYQQYKTVYLCYRYNDVQVRGPTFLLPMALCNEQVENIANQQHPAPDGGVYRVMETYDHGRILWLET